jgi:hypothetical protein
VGLGKRWGLAAIPAARVPGRGKSIDRAIDKSIDKAAFGSVNKSTNELSVEDHADDDSDRAREGATPWRFRACSPGERSEGLNRGSLPPSPDPWNWARSPGRVAPLGQGPSKSCRKPRGLRPKAAGQG